jgi:hypothetical protein
MARSAQKQASTNFDNSQKTLGQATDASHEFGGNASHLFGVLDPTLEQEALHPQGFSGEDLAAMNTAVGQATGGATAGAKGEGYLDAARTGNRGGFQTALDESAREGMRTNADAALNIQGQNANLRERNRQSGIAGLGALYGENAGDELKSLGLENESIGEGNQAIDEETKAGQSGWFQNMLGAINAASGAFKAYKGK